MKTRRGFTLIETVFAIFIFSVGALGLAATMAVIARSLGAAGAGERAARIASSRLEAIRSMSCGGQSGTESTQGFRSEWSVAPQNSVVSIVERVTYFVAGASRTDTYTATVPCAH